MKKYIYIILVIVVFITSCKDDFIDLNPLAQVTSSNFYRTVSDFNLAALGIYEGLQDKNFVESYFVLGELITENVIINAPIGGSSDNAYQINEFRVLPFNTHLQTMWQQSYNVIARANTLLARSEAIDLQSDFQRQYEGEAYFLRAFAHFNLVRIFGDVPLVLSEISPAQAFEIRRTPASQVYDQIISDLLRAEELLPNSYQGSNVGRATTWAAKALLGKVYLSKPTKEPARAIEKFNQISSGGFFLLNDFADVFNPANANNVESIFEIQFKSGLGTQGSPFADLLTPNNRLVNQLYPSGTATNGQGRGVVTQELVSKFNVEDRRFTASIGEHSNQSGPIFFQKKFNAPSSIFRDGDDNLIILRYADVLLMLAEAHNELNDNAKFSFINQVRQRAGLSNITVTDLPTQQAFKSALLLERQLEFSFEVHRWFDLVRLGEAVNVLGPLGLQPHMLIYPIPQREIDVSDGLITQNPNY